ncbi:transglutaminase domain-containing protein [Sphingobacterium siyangense]|jgi:transglutaminase-like putative cysteine protease|uniref:transglutaminase domain-containing protein n=1 Tax=Sphingobacterium siyangense TaxID=459529 RepID=UPI0028AC622E|nr:transglutaminase domain-containing protein [Sphingobacterium siyangense]
MRQFLTLFLIFSIYTNSIAQTFDFGKVSISDFSKTDLDSNANAIVLNEFGRSSVFVDDYDNRIKLQHEYHVLIRINNKEGFKKANFEIPSYKRGSYIRDYFDELKAVTYNLENGRIEKTELENKKVFRENYSAYLDLNKFTLPNIKEGSIIEVSYRTLEQDLFNFKTWEFQDDIPKIQSQYIAIIPASFAYNVVLRGPYKLTDQKAEALKEYIFLDGLRMDCSKLTYTMKNIPAFVEEDYMTSPTNFKSAIYYELESIFYPSTGSKKTFSKTWKDVDTDLMNEKAFGGQLKKTDLFKANLATIVSPTDTKLEKAKKIYNYINKQIKWNNYLGKYAESGIEKALEKRTGNIGDINLALVTALLAADLEAYPIILSTRRNGTPNALFPVLSDFDYVIACVDVDGVKYKLDASNSYLPFGELPLQCLNERGRIIYSKKSSDWFPLTVEESSDVSYVLEGALDEQAKIKGKLTISSRGNKAFLKRQHIAKFNSLEEYWEKLDEEMPNVTLTKSSIQNLEEIDQILIEEFDVIVDVTKQMGQNILLLAPNVIDRISYNPFKAQERTYPVDMGFKSKTLYSVKLTIPDHYEIAEKPQNASLALPESTAKYRYVTQVNGNQLEILQSLAFNKPIFSVDEYFSLKELYSRIIQQQKLDIKLIGKK